MQRRRMPVTLGCVVLVAMLGVASTRTLLGQATDPAEPAPEAAPPAPGDVILKRTSPDSPLAMPVAVFPHWRHRLFFTCNVCHPAIFPMRVGETTITMDDISAQKFCGTCHNGRVAWGVSVSTCARCHRGS